jgi:hypothetical protein
MIQLKALCLVFLHFAALFLVGAILAKAADGEWTMAAKDYANTRFSSLMQITAQNIHSLRCAWTFGTGVNRGQELRNQYEHLRPRGIERKLSHLEHHRSYSDVHDPVETR